MMRRDFLESGLLLPAVVPAPAQGIQTGQSEAPVRRVEGMPRMRLSIGADHAGFPMKGVVINMLKFWGHTVTDRGTFSPEPVDFPDIAKLVCEDVRSGRAERGIMVCGTGVGACIASNKMRGIRAALCHDAYSAGQSVEHDDVNVLCMGAWIIGPKTMEQVLAAFLTAKFSTEEQFRRRVQKLEQMDAERCAPPPAQR
ncbi:MAG: ribose 5-phosphate isomerase B [Bryobacteraceae bacterium]|nr:ribose 5-phosphate isomerase B [Bryobacteraceae bacterium]